MIIGFFRSKLNFALLTIMAVQSVFACSCVEAYTDEFVIAPGEKGIIKIRYNGEEQSGFQIERIHVFTNDPITPRAQLNITGYVRPAWLGLSARSMDFGAIDRREGAVRKIYFNAMGDSSLELLDVSADSPYIGSAIVKSIDGKTNHRIILRLLPNAPIGLLENIVTIHSNHYREPQVHVPVKALVKGNLEVFPKNLFFGIIKDNSQAESKVRISSKENQFKILSLSNIPRWINTKTIPINEGREYEIVANLNNRAPTGNIAKEIIVHTSDPLQPELKIPVFAFVDR